MRKFSTQIIILKIDTNQSKCNKYLLFCYSQHFNTQCASQMLLTDHPWADLSCRPVSFTDDENIGDACFLQRTKGECDHRPIGNGQQNFGQSISGCVQGKEMVVSTASENDSLKWRGRGHCCAPNRVFKLSVQPKNVENAAKFLQSCEIHSIKRAIRLFSAAWRECKAETVKFVCGGL